MPYEDKRDDNNGEDKCRYSKPLRMVAEDRVDLPSMFHCFLLKCHVASAAMYEPKWGFSQIRGVMDE